MRKKVGLDFDDVLFDFNAGLMEFHNAVYGTSYTLQDVTQWDFKELWQCHPDEALRRMREFVTSPYHRLTQPITGAVEFVKLLRTYFDTPVITARDKKLLVQTREVADKYFPNCLDEIHFLHDNDINVLGTKGEVCKRLGVSIMVEDSLGNAETLSHSGIPTLLFDRPWNQTEFLPPGVIRVYGWTHTHVEIMRALS
jgi:uncharacterized HAD superfamily protein